MSSAPVVLHAGLSHWLQLNKTIKKRKKAKIEDSGGFSNVEPRHDNLVASLK